MALLGEQYEQTIADMLQKQSVITVKCQILNVRLPNYADYRAEGNSVFEHKFGHFKLKANPQCSVKFDCN